MERWVKVGQAGTVTEMQMADASPGPEWTLVEGDLPVDVGWQRTGDTWEQPATTDSELVEQVVPRDGPRRVIFEMLFDLNNRVRVLEGKQAITRAQLRTWLQGKLR